MTTGRARKTKRTGEEDGHSDGTGQEQESSSESVDHHGTKDGGGVVGELQDSVDEGSGLGLGDTDRDEDRVQVVRDETVTGPLGKEGDGDNDPHPLQVTPALEQAEPGRALRGFPLEVDGRLALVEFVLGKRVRSVPGTVVLDEEVHSTLFLAVVDVPSGRLGDQEDEDDLEDRGETLQEGGDSPGPSVGDSESSVGGPGGDDGTEVPGRVVERGQGSTVGRERQLGDQEGGGGTGESETESDEAARSREVGQMGVLAMLRGCIWYAHVRAPMNIPMDCAAVWMATPANMTIESRDDQTSFYCFALESRHSLQEPKKMAARRPNLSAT
jgi:hypothetical protein